MEGIVSQGLDGDHILHYPSACAPSDTAQYAALVQNNLQYHIIYLRAIEIISYIMNFLILSFFTAFTLYTTQIYIKPFLNLMSYTN